MSNSTSFPHPFFSSKPNWKWFILVTVLIGATMSALDVSIVNVGMPTMSKDFNVSMSMIAWVAMAYMITLTIFLPFFGRLADMLGRTRLYTIGFVIFTVGSLLCGVAPSAYFLIGSRVLQAVGAGLLQANSVAIIVSSFPSSERGKAIGIQGAVQAISMSIGPLVGGILIAAIGWRAIFYVNLPIGIAGVTAALLILPKSEKDAEKEKVDYFGTLVFVIGLGALVLGINGMGTQGINPTIIAYLAIAVAFLAIFAITELKIKFPLIDFNMFKNGLFLLGNVTGMLSYYVLFAILFLMPFYMENVLNFSAGAAGLLLTPVPLSMAIVAPFSGNISDKYGSRIMTTAGMVTASAGCLAMFFLGSSTAVWLLIIELIIIGVGMGLFTPPNNSAIMGAAPRDKLSVAGGILNMTRSLGSIFGVAVSSLILTTLEHSYLTGKGYPVVKHVFSGNNIPVVDRDGAFLHGFAIAIAIMLGLTIISTVLSIAKKEGEMLDPEAVKEFEGV